MPLDADTLCRRLRIGDPGLVEVESKFRLPPREARAILDRLAGLRGVRPAGTKVFCDQFLDTPDRRLLRAGASLRLRCKGDGARVYLQYKGPGFHAGGLLVRSEYSSGRLRGVVLEAGAGEAVRFFAPSARDILARHAPPEMADAMRRHLGPRILPRITEAVVFVVYRKEKFIVDLGGPCLEPSVDRLFAVRLRGAGFQPLSAFWEYENEIKAPDHDLETKLAHLPDLLRFDRALARRFGLRPSRLDKYHRCAAGNG
jgi:hypothetical protein